MTKKEQNNSHGAEITIVAHDGHFHADDAFAVATLMLALGKNDDSQADAVNFNVIRTRDTEIIKSADYVVDVGGVYDPEQNCFDHHQTGGAGERTNTIPYASFGLVWKKFGEDLAGSKEAAEFIDQKLIQSVDATDNGVPIVKELFTDVRPYGISSVIAAMNPNWNEEGSEEGSEEDRADELFMKAVTLAKEILVREIQGAQSGLEARKHVLEAYEKSEDKRVIVFEQKYPFDKVFSELPEPLFVIYPKQGRWYVKTVRDNVNYFQNRKDLPTSWAGKRDAELSAVTGVPGSIFCHNKLFLACAETKEGAIKMAEIAVES